MACLRSPGLAAAAAVSGAAGQQADSPAGSVFSRVPNMPRFTPAHNTK
jgi:hypothetical protein